MVWIRTTKIPLDHQYFSMDIFLIKFLNSSKENELKTQKPHHCESHKQPMQLGITIASKLRGGFSDGDRILRDLTNTRLSRSSPSRARFFIIC